MKTSVACMMGLICVSLAAGASAQSQPSDDPIVCKAAQTLELSNVNIKTSKTSVIAKDHCTLVIRGGTIEGAVALKVSDGARVELYDVELKGSKNALEGYGEAVVVVDDVRVTGGALIEGTSRIERKGPLKRLDADASDAGVKDASKLTPSEPIKCVGNKTMRIENKLIESKRDGILVQGRCKVTIVNSRVIAEDDGLIVQGKSVVVLLDSEIIAKDASIRLVGGAVLDMKGSKVKGGVKRMGGAKLIGRGGNQFN